MAMESWFLVVGAVCMLVGLIAGVKIGGRLKEQRIAMQLPDYRDHKDFERLQNFGNRAFNKLSELIESDRDLRHQYLVRKDPECLKTEDGKLLFPIYQLWVATRTGQHFGLLRYDAKTRQIWVRPCNTGDHMPLGKLFHDVEADEAAQFYFDHLLEDMFGVKKDEAPAVA